MRIRRGFTLVELVVVVLILGILAAIAAPKIINNSDKATDSSAASTLQSIRDAIELYKTDYNGKLPAGSSALDSATLQTLLDPYIRGTTFPKCPVGGKNSNIRVVTSGTSIGAPSGSDGWAYHSTLGDFIINSSAAMASDASTNYNQL